MKRIKQFTSRMLAVMLAGTLAVGSVSVSAFGAEDAGSTAVAAEEFAHEETTEEGVAESSSAEVTAGEGVTESPDAAFADTTEIAAEEVAVTSYTVTLDANGGYFANEMDDVLNETLEKTEILNKIIPVGGGVSTVPLNYQESIVTTFLGWSLERDGEILPQEQEGYAPVGDCVLYAVWGDESDAADTSVAMGEDVPEEVLNDTIETGEPDAWTPEEEVDQENDSENVLIDETAGEENADEAPATYAVTLDANGGFFVNEWDDVLGEYVEQAEVVTKYIPVGGTINVVPVTDQKDGVGTFLGWSLERDGELEWQAQEKTDEMQETEGYAPVDRCVLYAIWGYGEAADEAVEYDAIADETTKSDDASEDEVNEFSEEGIEDEISFKETYGKVDGIEYFDIDDVNGLSNAITYLRRNMVGREKTVTVGVYANSFFDDSNVDDFSALIQNIYNCAIEHTGNPNEGDYLKNSLYGKTEMSGKYDNYYSSLGKHAYLITYHFDYKTTLEQEKEILSEVQRVIMALKDAGYDIQNMSDYDKAKTLYGYLIYGAQYDYNFSELTDDEVKLERSAYGSLILHKAICAGYASALYYLFNYVGIDARTITGVVESGTTELGNSPLENGDRHAWNIAKIDDSYYLLDATFDSCDSYQDVLHYFLSGSTNQIFMNGRTPDSEYENKEFKNRFSISKTDYVPPEQKHTLHFDSNGGSGITPIDRTVINGEKYGESIKFTVSRQGYTFTGWYTEPEGGIQITEDTVVNLTADQTLYAHWEEGTYTVTFDPNGGTLKDPQKDHASYIGNKKYGSFPEVSRENYVLLGWYDAPTGGTKVDEMTTISFKDHTLYAQWRDDSREEENYIGADVISFHYSASDGTRKEHYFFYSDYLFFVNENNIHFRTELALASLGLQMSAMTDVRANSLYSTKLDKNDYSRAANIKELLNELKFKNPVFYNYDKPLNDPYDRVAFTVAHKYINAGEDIGDYSQGEDTVLLIAIRGGGYGAEWASNFNVVDGNNYGDSHHGFSKAAEEVQSAANEYVRLMKKEGKGIHGELKLWITGYSRGAAVANKVAHDLNINGVAGETVHTGNMYAYTFATPNVGNSFGGDISYKKYPKDSSIINVISPADIVPNVPLSLWGYGKYGRTLYLPTYNYSELWTWYTMMSGKFLTGGNTPISDGGILKQADAVTAIKELLGKVAPDRIWYRDYFQDNIWNTLKSANQNKNENEVMEAIKAIIGFVDEAKNINSVVDVVFDSLDLPLRYLKGDLSNLGRAHEPEYYFARLKCDDLTSIDDFTRCIPNDRIIIKGLDSANSVLTIYKGDNVVGSVQQGSITTDLSVGETVDKRFKATTHSVDICAFDDLLFVELYDDCRVELSAGIEQEVSYITQKIDDDNSVIDSNTVESLVLEEGEITKIYDGEKSLMDSGSCGDNLTWTLDDKGQLTINGTGEMTDWAYSDLDDDSIAWFAYRESIKHVYISSEVTSVGNSAFENCSNLSNVVFGENLKKIGNRSFASCSSLITCTFTGEAPEIEYDSFKEDTFTAYYPIFNNVEKKVAWYHNRGDYTDETGNITWTRYLAETITGNCGKNGENVLWELETDGNFRINGIGIIPDYYISFYQPWYDYREFIKKVEIGEGITHIGRGAFSFCENVLTVTLANTVSTMGMEVFEGCHRLEKINLPKGLTTVPHGAFNDCVSLRKITIPEAVTAIGQSAFNDCSNLESIVFPGALTEIDYAAFRRCNSLKMITIPKNVVRVGGGAFSGCDNLKSVTILSNGLSIETEVFGNCPSLKTVIFRGNAPSFQLDIQKTGDSPNQLFLEDNLTAYYPGGNDTWTIEIKQNYGGNVTWATWNTDISQFSVEVKPNSFIYDGKEKKPSVSLEGDSSKLTEGVDFKVSYSNNLNSGNASFTVTGTGNYYGKLTGHYKINKAAQSITAKAAASRIAVGKTTTVSITGNKGSKSFKSSDTTIATVDKSMGKVTAKKVGTVKITATSAATANYNAASKTVTIKVVPAATATLKADNQASGIKLTWKKVTGANGYKIYRGSTLIKTITNSSTVTFADTKANTNGTKYTYKVVAKAATGDSTLSKSVAVYRVARPAVSSVTNSAVGKMTVKWGKNAKANGYQIQYSQSKTFASGNKAVTVAGASVVSKVIGSLTKSKTYYVRIRTYKTVGSAKYWSVWSPTKSVKIPK